MPWLASIGAYRQIGDRPLALLPVGEPSLAHVTCDVVHGAVQLSARLYRARHPATGESDRAPRPAVRDVAEPRPVHPVLAPEGIGMEAVLDVPAF